MTQDILTQWTLWRAKAQEDPEVIREMEELMLLPREEREKEIGERFYKELEFGTGGLRGIMGAGPNRLNLYTVSRASRGYARYLKNSARRPGAAGAQKTGTEALRRSGSHPEAPLQAPSLVIAYDTRIRSREFARRAAEVAAAGGHNLLLLGSPGSGKSMIAQRLPSILPELSFEASIETTQSHSIAGLLPQGVSLLRNRPFRAPHHTISAAGLSGGGSIPRPGELSLAHNGVLFLDEVPEFDRQVLEVLRQPMEEAAVTIARVNGTLTYPCQVLLVAAMNPCPCGYFGHPNHKCRCSPQQVARYLGRISGPFLDRIDLHIELAPVKFSQLTKQQKGETSAQIRERVNRARAIQLARYAGTGIRCNAQLTPELLRQYCQVTDEGMAQLKLAFERLDLSARGYDRILKVARTIADLAESPQIQKEHICEAIVYRSLDRKYWGKI